MSRHLLVIGAQRSGTTYLYRLLDEHPEVAMARPARPEPKFFLDSQRYARGLAWYRQTYFDGRTANLLGEKSTSYIESPEAARRAASLLGPAHVVAVLRDPVARAISNWQFSVASGLETRALDAALAQNLEGAATWDPAQTSVSPFAYLERGRYVDHLQPWHEQFGDMVHVFFTDEITGPDGPALLYRALGVDAGYHPAAAGVAANASAHPPPRLDADLDAAVRVYFQDSDRRLAALLGRAVPWRTAAHATGT